MNGSKRSGKWLKFLIYLVVLVLLNATAVTLFRRFDLTAGKIYSLSDASKRVVATLSEPLTIKVFFSRNLPAPYNHTEQYLRDLLEEYAVYADRYLNYTFHDVTPKEGGEVTTEAGRNQQLAAGYGIDPIQVQVVEKDEVKFQKAYMGLVLIHGDMIERLPALTSTDGLEYRLTTAIQKLNNKVSALLRLQGKIQVNLYLSSSLYAVAPHLRVNGLDGVPEQMAAIVKGLEVRTHGKIEYRHLDPSKDPVPAADAERYQLLRLKWPELDGGKVPAGEGVSGLVMAYGEKSVTIPVLEALRLPLIGTRYQLADLGKMEQVLNDNLESLIDINQNLGYLADHGTPALFGAMPGMAERGDGLGNFNQLISENYSIQQVRLGDGAIPDGINCLVIARPTEPFTEYELFQLDQFLMRGKSLALFLDPFKETMPPRQAMAMGQGPGYEPFDSGLEKLLEHYGLGLDRALVLDENCFRQQVPAQFGGGERAIYFAPLIKNQNIDHGLGVTENIKGLVVLQAAPAQVVADRIKANGLTATQLFTSSGKSWLMKPPINLNPMFLQPPAKTDEMKPYPLAYLVEGEFPSYFAARPIPEKPRPQPEEKSPGEAGGGKAEAPPAAADAAEPPAPATGTAAAPAAPEIEGQGAVIARGKPGKIFFMGASSMLQDNLLDQEGRSPNAILVANLIDYLNGREDIARMRGKQQLFNPLIEIGAGAKTVIKSVNIVGLPILVVCFGLLVWLKRRGRRKRIQLMFQK